MASNALKVSGGWVVGGLCTLEDNADGGRSLETQTKTTAELTPLSLDHSGPAGGSDVLIEYAVLLLLSPRAAVRGQPPPPPRPRVGLLARPLPPLAGPAPRVLPAVPGRERRAAALVPHPLVPRVLLAAPGREWPAAALVLPLPGPGILHELVGCLG